MDVEQNEQTYEENAQIDHKEVELVGQKNAVVGIAGNMAEMAQKGEALAES